MSLSLRKRFAWVVALTAAVGVLFAPAAFASTGVGTPLTTHTQAMDGNLQVAQGSTLSVGYDFTMPGNHPLAQVGFMGTTVTFNATCASGHPGSQTIEVDIADRSYSDPANSSAWYPSGDQNDPSTYQGSTTVPSFCDQGALVRLQQGGTFSTNVSSADTQDKVNLRWHYKDGTGGGWSGTYSANPSPVTGCAVTNTNTNLIYSTLQGAQDQASDGDTLTVQNTCTGPTTISHSLTITGDVGTSPTLDGNHAGSVLTFDKNLTYNVNHLTIQDGNATNGGGVYMNDGSTGTFDHDNVINNVADRLGSGFYIDDGSTAKLSYNVVMNDKGPVAVADVGANLTMTFTTVSANVVSDNTTTAPVWDLSLAGTITGGAYELQLDGDTTTPLPYDATAAQIQTALESLPNADPGTVDVEIPCPICAAPDIQITFHKADGTPVYRAMALTDSTLAGGGASIGPKPIDTAAIKYYETSTGTLQTLSSTVKVVNSNVGTSLTSGGATYSTDLTSTGFQFALVGPTCVFNQETRMGFPTLQAAVDDSLPGDTLQLVGTCEGQTTFTHTVGVIGPGVLDGGGITPVIVPQGVSVLMNDLSITNGVGMLGGGVHNDGFLGLDHTTVSGNHANDAGGGIYNSGGLEISDFSSITNNTSDGAGGGIDNSATGHVVLSVCDISGNSAEVGGGVANEGGSFGMNQATIDGNTAASGGGIWLSGGNVVVQDGSAITGNTATGTPPLNAGGVFNLSGTLTINDTSTVTGNSPTDILP